MGDRQFKDSPQEAHILLLFRSISDDGQADALVALEALARVSPRRPVSLRLLPGGAASKAGSDSQ